MKIKNDDSLEWQFILDYAEFGLRINFEAIVALCEKAVTIEDPILRKIICLSGLQSMFSSWEDFALLLQGLKKRKDEGWPIHRYLWGEKQGSGSSDVPSVFKDYRSARQMLDALGFTSITHKSLTKYYVDISKGKSEVAFHRFLDPQISAYRHSISKALLEKIYRNFADNVKSIGKGQAKYNDLKNRLKHGKGTIEGFVGEDNSDRVAYLKHVKGNENELEVYWVNVSLASLKNVVIQIAQLYLRSLELLWLFMIHYYPDHVEEYRKIYVDQGKSCEKKVEDLGVKLSYVDSTGKTKKSIRSTARSKRVKR